MAEEAAPKQRETRRGSLHDLIMHMEPLTDRLFRWLPEWVRDVAQDRRRHLLYMERQMQRRLINEFRAQARELEPVLHSRGRMVGEVLVEAMTSSSDADVTYGEIVAAQLKKTSVGEKLPMGEVVATLDPLLEPFITPFVEGIKSPINDKASEIQATLVQSFAATAACGVLVGIVIGRVLPRGGGGGDSRGGRR